MQRDRTRSYHHTATKTTMGQHSVVYGAERVCCLLPRCHTCSAVCSARVLASNTAIRNASICVRVEHKRQTQRHDMNDTAMFCVLRVSPRGRGHLRATQLTARDYICKRFDG